MFLFFLVHGAISCSQLGQTCTTNDDCCVDPCSPTSCFQGLCIGSTCLGFGSSCQLDCQCCSGSCVKNELNPGTCVEEKISKIKHNISQYVLDNCGSCCSAGDCQISGTFCNICCPVGSSSHCNSNTCQCWCSSSGMNDEAITSKSVR